MGRRINQKSRLVYPRTRSENRRTQKIRETIRTERNFRRFLPKNHSWLNKWKLEFVSSYFSKPLYPTWRVANFVNYVSMLVLYTSFIYFTENKSVNKKLPPYWTQLHSSSSDSADFSPIPNVFNLMSDLFRIQTFVRSLCTVMRRHFFSSIKGQF